MTGLSDHHGRNTHMEEQLDVSGEYQAVLEDLLAWIQNAALSEITGERVPPREPKDPKLARMVQRADGQLTIIADGGQWPIAPDPSQAPRSAGAA